MQYLYLCKRIRRFFTGENLRYRPWKFVEIHGISLKILTSGVVENDVENVYNLLYLNIIVKFM